MSAVAVEPGIATELWVSFVSLLQSYMAAARLSRGIEAAVVVDEYCVSMDTDGAALVMRFNPLTATAEWQISRPAGSPSEGIFEFLPDGSLLADGTIKDLDFAAIDFVSFATSAATTSGTGA